MRVAARSETLAGERARSPRRAAAPSASESLSRAVDRACARLLKEQQKDGHWIYPLEADVTIPAEYILMNHFIGEVDPDTEQRIARYLRTRQQEDGGWPLFSGGDFNMSASVKAYYALRLAGDLPDAPHMLRAKVRILAHGGAARSNVFTRITLALFAQLPWRATPFIPAEAILLPRWFPFHLRKVSYWSRTVMVPLFVLCTLKPRAANPRGVGIPELFTVPAEQERHYFLPPKTIVGWCFTLVDRLGRRLEWLLPGRLRRHALRRCEQWFLERMNDEHGIGGIFPAMVNVLESLVVLGYPADDPARQRARQAVDSLLVREDSSIWCQPCVSPVWDTCLAVQGALEADAAPERMTVALDWLQARQLSIEPGDWRASRPQLAGGGWAFQYRNDHYPDLDDTAMVAWAMCLHDPARYRRAIDRAAAWLAGMQSANGGFGSFDADNCCYYLNAIPFADHGALLDPPTADVTARVVAFLALAGRGRYREPLQRAIDYLLREQEPSGAWYGRWGTNYVYGTWSVLSALELAGPEPRITAAVQAAVRWLYAVQQLDGGWGESNRSYYPGMEYCAHPSTPHQTAWALLALLAAGQKDSPAVQAGIAWLLARQNEQGLWQDPSFTAPGFPRVFYLKYHGYCRYFPLWALARYRRLLSSGTTVSQEQG